MAITKLSVYNEALRLIGEQPLASLTDDVPARYTLDEALQDVILDGLSRGLWNFAIKTSEFQPDESATPSIGYLFAYQKPDDWLSTTATSTFPDFRDYYSTDGEVVKDQGGMWHAESRPLYVEYISSDSSLDENMGNWTPLFARFIAASLALDVCNRLTQSSTMIEMLSRETKRRLLLAKSRDARDEKEARVRPGAWVRSQRGYASRRNQIRSAAPGQLNLRQGKI